MLKVSAFRWVPPFAQGLARDFRVRWALEEAGVPYEERLIGPEDQDTEFYRSLQPFGQIPAFEEDEFSIFESGAIVLRIAERSEALMPPDPEGRARMITWMFAALNSVEPHVQNLASLDHLLCERRMGEVAPALGGANGEEAIGSLVEAPGGSRLPRAPIYGCRSLDDDRTAHAPSHRHRVANAGPGILSPALRSAAGIQKSDGRSHGALRKACARGSLVIAH